MKAHLEKRLIELLAKSVGGLTPGVIIQEMRAHFPVLDRRALQDLVKELAADGRLIYTLCLGSTRIALGGYKPQHVSQRVYLTTSPSSEKLPPGAVCVHVVAGTAFGSGDHPTTCMMLRALDQAIAVMRSPGEVAAARVLDVGTGNGVLAIAALLLGAGTAVGVDIDPQACHEARVNAGENGVAQRFSIIAGSVQLIGERRFDLVLANLRPPTLAGLLPSFGSLLTDAGAIILSGFRRSEQPDLERLLPEGMAVVWQDNDRDWAALIARKGSSVFRAPFRGCEKGG